MTREQDIDRLIDRAAEQMVGREPSSALTDTVMARVRAADDEAVNNEGAGFRVLGSGFSGLRWGFAVGVAAIFLSSAVVLMNRTASDVAEKPTVAPSEQRVAARVPTPLAQTASSGGTAEPAASVVRRAPRSRAALLPAIEEMEPFVDPIALEPISDDPIQVSEIEVVSELIDEITVEPLVIEPLTASND